MRNRLDDEVIITIYLHGKYANCLNTRGQRTKYFNNLLKKLLVRLTGSYIFGWMVSAEEAYATGFDSGPETSRGPWAQAHGTRCASSTDSPETARDKSWISPPGKINATRMARERRSFAARLIIDVLYLAIRHDEYHNTNNKSTINTVSINLIIN